MSGGLIQLVAVGIQDEFIIENPQITFFKMVYRRHTNFTTEPIAHFFTDKPKFGKKVTCVISRQADLIRKMHLVIVLPSIPKFKDENNDEDVIKKFAWVKKIGFALIKEIEIEIGGTIIDRQFGDWLNIWNELNQPDRKEISKMLGDVKQLTEFSNGKKMYKLFIPLQFWFNRITGMALPTVSLENNHVKLHLEINSFSKLHVTTPTHYIDVKNDFVNFKKQEYLEQEVDGIKSLARFVHFDPILKRMYFQRISDNKFITSTDKCKHKNKLIIRGLTSKFEAHPQIDVCEKRYRNNSVDFGNIEIKDAFLLVEHIYLDSEERQKFSEINHEYLIEQVQFNGEHSVDSAHQMFKLGFTHPVKELFWVTQLGLVTKSRINDHFNYTDSLINGGLGCTENCFECYEDECADVCTYTCSAKDRIVKKGRNMIKRGTILFNGKERVSLRDNEYFSWIQPYQHHSNSPSVGVNSYSFALEPEKHQPSCTANLTKLDDVRLKLEVSPSAIKRDLKLRVYSISYNVLRISAGLCGLVFSNDNS
jgi:hypothetical protein